MTTRLEERVAPWLERVAAVAPVVRATADWSEAHSRPAEALVDADRTVSAVATAAGHGGRVIVAAMAATTMTRGLLVERENRIWIGFLFLKLVTPKMHLRRSFNASSELSAYTTMWA